MPSETRGELKREHMLFVGKCVDDQRACNQVPPVLLWALLEVVATCMVHATSPTSSACPRSPTSKSIKVSSSSSACFIIVCRGRRCRFVYCS
jgi:hypothetical protein